MVQRSLFGVEWRLCLRTYAPFLRLLFFLLRFASLRSQALPAAHPTTSMVLPFNSKGPGFTPNSLFGPLCSICCRSLQDFKTFTSFLPISGHKIMPRCCRIDTIVCVCRLWSPYRGYSPSDAGARASNCQKEIKLSA